MKAITGNNDLQKLGINLLTGEACAYSMRILCDLSADGVALIQDFFGLPVASTFEKNWNSMVGDQESVASIMLPHSFLPLIVRFALFNKGYKYVVGAPDSIQCTAYNESDLERNDAIRHQFELIREGQCSFLPNVRVFTNPKSPSQPSEGSRNVHAFTGRVS